MTDSVKADTAKVVRLVRHAQSAANAGLSTTAPDTIPLTDLGRLQAQALADSMVSVPDLIVASSFERARDTAIPTAKRYSSVPFEIWDVEEFTYLSPERFAGTTQADRKPMVDSYWGAGDQSLIDGSGAESFVELLERAKMMLDQLGHSDAKSVLIFSHGQFIRAVAWFIQHGEEAGSPDMMRRFRELDVGEPLVNCAGYEIVLKDGQWTVEFLLSHDGVVKFIDHFCTDQSTGPVPLAPMTREVRDFIARSKPNRDTPE